MSRLQTLTITSFKRLNPNWKTILHLIKADKLGENTYVPDYKGPDYYNEIELLFDEVRELYCGIEDKHGILLSDIIRLEALKYWGGIYSDFDVIWLKPMSEFPYSDFETTFCYHLSGHINQSIIVSEPDGDFLKFVIEQQNQVKPPYGHQAFNSELLLNLFPKADGLTKRFPGVQLIPYELFYPYSIFNLESLYNKTDLSFLKEAMCVHWFNGHELSRDYADDNTFSRECSMTKILKEGKLI